MFGNRLGPFQDLQRPGDSCPGNLYARQYNIALSQFKLMLLKGRISRFKKKLMRSPVWLYDLNLLKPHLSLRGCFYSGIQVVRIGSVIGSENRTADFDMDFHPIREFSRERWINMAMASLSCLTLPPIQLIQVGDAYFVRDGHHRLSVSRAFGQLAMDAEVIAWKAAPPFPWQTDTIRNELFSHKSLDLPT